MTVNKPTDSEVKALSDKFAESHFIRFDNIFEDDRIGVYWLQKINNSIEDALKSRIDPISTLGPTWAITRTMLARVYEHCEGSFVTWITGTWSSAEVAVRAVMEAAVNLMYIVSDDKEKRLVQYFSNFWDTQKKFSRRRLEMASRLQDEAANAYKDAAEQNIKFEGSRENLLNTILLNEGFLSVNEPGWPEKILDRFISLGMEEEYKTVYSFLSSEAHNDASAVVDFMIYQALESQVPEQAVREVYLRNRIYVYMGLRYFLRAAYYYGISYSLDVGDEIMQAKKAVDKIIEELSVEIINLPASMQSQKDSKNGDRQKRKKHRRRKQ
jgi:hypothetical protein